MKSFNFFIYSLIGVLLFLLILDPGDNKSLNIFIWIAIIGFFMYKIFSTDHKSTYKPPAIGYGNGFTGRGSGGFGGGFMWR